MKNPIEIPRPSRLIRLRWKLDSLKYRAVEGWRDLCDKAKWIGHKPGNLETYAEEELRRAGLYDADSSYGGMLGPAVLRMIREFASEGHSGFSAGMALSIFEKVADFKPLSPLTGEDDEWNEVGTGIFQNRRCSTVFKEKGRAYNGEGRIFREPNGCCYTSSGSHVTITFPYMPTSEYVDVPELAS
jgi:hypothetical protein